MRRIATLVLSVLAAAALAAAATAGQPVRETIHAEEDFIEEDFCGAPGLDVRFQLALDIRVKGAPRGKDGLVYFLQHGTRSDTVTNVANGKSVSALLKVLEKDKRVTDNGDGTLTVLILATGNAVLYAPDGNAIARDPGQIRFEIVIDHRGTPNDPDDDTELDFRIVKESTGRSDDFCAAAVPELT